MRDVALPLARLGRALRAEGVGTSLRDELDAAEALALVDLEDREEVRRTLRIALKIPRAAFDGFDRLLAVFWGAEPEAAPSRAPRRDRETPALPRGRLLHWDAEARRMGDAAGTPRDGERPGFSPLSLLRRKPFDQLEGPELAAMERLLVRLARRLAARRSRRLVPTHGRGRPDVRSSYRQALRTGGELVALARRTRAQDAPRLVLLLDTSGSMDGCGRFLLTFALSLRRAVPRAEVFVFNTELNHVTRSLTAGKVGISLERLLDSVPDWSGGTRIGESLAAFVEGHLQRHTDRKTVVVVLSDGLDRGSPALLAEALRRIQLRVRKLIWLNPLLGDPRYQPVTGGMLAALPFVDHFAAAHDLASLERLLPHLSN